MHAEAFPESSQTIKMKLLVKYLTTLNPQVYSQSRTYKMKLFAKRE